MLEESIKAHQLLSDLGFQVGLVNIRNLKPFDGDLISKLASQTSCFITIEDHFLTGGLFSILAEHLVKNQILIPTHSIAFEDRWFKPGRLAEVLVHEGLDAKSLVEKIQNFIQK